MIQDADRLDLAGLSAAALRDLAATAREGHADPAQEQCLGAPSPSPTWGVQHRPGPRSSIPARPRSSRWDRSRMRPGWWTVRKVLPAVALRRVVDGQQGSAAPGRRRCAARRPGPGHRLLTLDRPTPEFRSALELRPVPAGAAMRPSGSRRTTWARAPASSFGGVEVSARSPLIRVGSGSSGSKWGASANTDAQNSRMAPGRRVTDRAGRPSPRPARRGPQRRRRHGLRSLDEQPGDVLRVFAVSRSAMGRPLSLRRARSVVLVRYPACGDSAQKSNSWI